MTKNKESSGVLPFRASCRRLYLAAISLTYDDKAIGDMANGNELPAVIN